MAPVGYAPAGGVRRGALGVGPDWLAVRDELQRRANEQCQQYIASCALAPPRAVPRTDKRPVSPPVGNRPAATAPGWPELAAEATALARKHKGSALALAQSLGLTIISCEPRLMIADGTGRALAGLLRLDAMTLYIADDLSPREAALTTAHECGHVLHPDATEAAAEHFASCFVTAGAAVWPYARCPYY